MSTITTNANLRGLLRTARRHARLSQKDAAIKAGVSPAWWKRVESAYETRTDDETLANMLDAVGVLPEHLDEMREPHMAELVMARQAFRSINNHGSGESLEDYLMRAPAPEALRRELVAYVEARMTMPKVGRQEPFADQFNPDAE